MTSLQDTALIRLRPRHDLIYVSQNQTVLATDLDGFVRPGPDRGLFFHQTRLLSRYRYLINDKPPQPIALSNVEQHSWLGYYIVPAPGVRVAGTRYGLATCVGRPPMGAGTNAAPAA